MKNYTTEQIRNVVLLGGTRSGKTTLAEAMLFEGKVIDRRGTVEGKNTVSDNTEVEQIFQRSIYSTPLYAEYKDHKINVIDAPGADDFVEDLQCTGADGGRDGEQSLWCDGQRRRHKRRQLRRGADAD